MEPYFTNYDRQIVKTGKPIKKYRNQACFIELAEPERFNPENKTVLYIPNINFNRKDFNCYFSLRDIKNWIKFLNKCGMPCKYQKILTMEWLGTKYPTHIIYIYDRDCVSWKHRLAIMTSLRYLYEDNYYKIIENCLTLHRKGFKAFNALIAGHALSGISFNGHTLMHSSNCSLKTKKEWLEKMSNNVNIQNSFK